MLRRNGFKWHLKVLNRNGRGLISESGKFRNEIA